VYWSVYRLGLQERKESFWDQLQQYYAHQEAWESHRRDLLEFAAFTRSNDLKLLVVIIPDLNRIEKSAPIAEKVADVFASVDIPVLDITSRLFEWGPPRTMTVNALNGHANEAVSQDIGQWIYNELLAQEFIDIASDH
jgi:hypothetical protein